MEEKMSFGERSDGVDSNKTEPAKKSDRGKRKAGAVVFTVLIVVMMLLYIVFLLGIFFIGGGDPLSDGAVVIMIAIPVLVIIGVVYACRERMQEIERGELDEADKY